MPFGYKRFIHCLLKNRLVEYSRKNYARHMKQIDKPIKKRALDKILNPDALTIGFARRFAPYKRATLLLKEKNRLINLLNDPEHPLQFIFSGKAHPRDLQGQSLLKELYQFSKRPKVKGKIIFLENYNIDVARFLVQGVDIWLNTPIRPMEASGTSGEKAGMNGILNFSILDGWWPECAEHGKNGWNIGTGEATEQSDKQDELDAGCMYDVLEGEIIPLYFQRSEGNVPHGWVQCMKESIKAVTRQFNTHRMVKEYFESLYIPAGSTEQDVWHLGQDLVS